MEKKVIKTWGGLKIGYRNLYELISHLKQSGLDTQTQLLVTQPEFRVVPTEREVRLCITTVGDLVGGGTKDAEAVFSAVKRIGGQLCPPETALFFYNEYSGRIPRSLLFCMEPINTPFHGVFGVEYEHKIKMALGVSARGELFSFQTQEFLRPTQVVVFIQSEEVDD